MKIQKFQFIEIKIPETKGNENRFTDVELLVDNLAFLKEVKKLREKYKIHNLYALEDTYEFTSGLHLKGLYEQFNSDIENLRKRFGKPLNFIRVIKRTIINGVVRDEDYLTAYLEEHDVYPLPGKDLTEVKYSIVVFPYSSLEDVKKAFRKFKKLTKLHAKASQKQETELVSKYQFIAGFKNYPRFDTKSSIFRIRDWYLRYKQGEKPLMIALKDKGLTHNKFREMKKISNTHKNFENRRVSDQEYEKVEESLIDFEKYHTNIKEQLKRHRKLLMQP